MTTMTISMEQIKELRSRTGAGVVDAKQALTQSAGDMDKAISWLREKGKATAAKKSSRETNEGVIGSYIHTNGRVAVLVTLLCETDFVARNEKFQDLGRSIAMHIAAMDPVVVSPADVPQAELEEERQLALKQLADQNKPEEIREKIVAGKLKKYAEEKALLTQPYVKDPKKTVENIIQEAIHELGENITVREFARLSI